MEGNRLINNPISMAERVRSDRLALFQDVSAEQRRINKQKELGVRINDEARERIKGLSKSDNSSK